MPFREEIMVVVFVTYDVARRLVVETKFTQTDEEAPSPE